MKQPAASLIPPHLRLKRRAFCGVGLAAALPVAAQSEHTAPSPPGWPLLPLAVSEAVDAAFLSPILTLIGQAAKLRWERNAVPFARMLRLVELGDTIGFGISPTEGRTEHLRFSAPVFRGAVWSVSRQDRQLEAKQVDDLRGRVVCVSREASYGNALPHPASIGIDARPVSGDLSRRLRTLEAGHCDVLLVTSRNTSADSVLARIRAAGADMQALRISKQPLVEQEVHFAVAKASPLASWLPRIDAALNARRKEIDRWVRLGEE